MKCISFAYACFIGRGKTKVFPHIFGNVGLFYTYGFMKIVLCFKCTINRVINLISAVKKMKIDCTFFSELKRKAKINVVEIGSGFIHSPFGIAPAWCNGDCYS